LIIGEGEQDIDIDHLKAAIFAEMSRGGWAEIVSRRVSISIFKFLLTEFPTAGALARVGDACFAITVPCSA